jgi:hypothetical protein
MPPGGYAKKEPRRERVVHTHNLVFQYAIIKARRARKIAKAARKRVRARSCFEGTVMYISTYGKKQMWAEERAE